MKLLQTPKTSGKVLVVGALVLDRIIYVPQLPRPGETAIGNRMEIHPGGKANNQAVAARKIGAEVALLSAVGKDASGEMLLDNLKQAGIDIAGIFQIKDVPTGEAVIIVDDSGQNQIAAYAGAYYQLTPDLVRQRKDLFTWADWVLVQNEIRREVTDTAIELALDCDCRVVFNPAPFNIDSPNPREGLDLLIPNEIEAAGLLRIDDYLQSTVDERRIAWMELGYDVVVTLGEQGAEHFDKAGEYCKYDPFAVEAIDTVGAGDAFCGILVGLLAEGLSLEDAIRIANYGAALSTTRRGAQAGLPDREELIKAKIN